MSMENKAKLVALRESIKNAIENGNLVEKMDVLKLQAADLGLNENNLNELIDEVNRQNDTNIKVASVANNNKTLLTCIIVGIVVVEWILGLVISNVSLATIIWILVVNVITIVLVLVLISIIVNKKIK